jgi:hypothetical protein
MATRSRRRCRERGLRDTFLVALTGYALPEDERRAADAGFDAHLSKPATIERTQEILARAPRRDPTSLSRARGSDDAVRDCRTPASLWGRPLAGMDDPIGSGLAESFLERVLETGPGGCLAPQGSAALEGTSACGDCCGF